jgi:hypothetical protein
VPIGLLDFGGQLEMKLGQLIGDFIRIELFRLTS